MSDIEQTVRAALHTAVDAVVAHPDEGDVGRRVALRRGRRRTRRAAVAIVALTAAAATSVLVPDRSTSPDIPAATTEPPAPVTTTAPSCAVPDALPFAPTVLPEGWGPAAIGAYQRTSGAAVWNGPGGVIEVWNGGRGNLPLPEARIEPITILGRAGTIGDISDGYSAIVDLGPGPCGRWALVAHPGTTKAQLRAVAEGLVPVLTQPTSPATTATAAVDNGSFRLVSRLGSQLVETDAAGTTHVLASLPDVPDVDPVLASHGDHLVVTYLGRVLVYETRPRRGPIDAGDRENLGFALDDTGFWQADIPPAGDTSSAWRKYDWAGNALGPASPVVELSLPIGALDDGIALWTKGPGHVLVSTSEGVRDLGKAMPIAAQGTTIAFQVRPGAIELYDTGTRTTRTIATPAGTHADVALAGRFSPDGRWLAIVVADDDNGRPALLLVEPASGGVLATGSTAGTVAGWSTDSALVFVEHERTVSAVSPDRTRRVPDVTLDPGTSPGVVILSPA